MSAPEDGLPASPRARGIAALDHEVLRVPATDGASDGRGACRARAGRVDQDGDATVGPQHNEWHERPERPAHTRPSQDRRMRQ